MKRSHCFLIVIVVVSIFILSCKAIKPPDILVQPTSMNFGEIDSVKTLKIINEGDERLDWSIDTSSFSAPWLTIDPISGYNEQNVTVKISRGGLSHASYKANFKVISNGGDASVEVVMIVF